MDPEFRRLLQHYRDNEVRRLPRYKPDSDIEEIKVRLLERQGQLDFLDYIGFDHE